MDINFFFLIKTNTNVAHKHKKSTCNHAEKYSKWIYSTEPAVILETLRCIFRISVYE